jgi:DNA-binding PadR family transcriptional regulator
MARRPAAESLKRNWFHVLVALADADRHGFDIMRDVLEQTSGTVRLWPATLYGTLDQLAGAGLISELASAGEHPAGQSEKRRYYRITRQGRAALAAEINRLEATARAAKLRLSPPRSAELR